MRCLGSISRCFRSLALARQRALWLTTTLVLIDYVNRLRSQGMGAFGALVKAGVGRFRPIMLTSFTTFIGLLPIMFERSTDAQFLKPTIVSLAFGVAFATAVTLIFVPAMYAVGADIARFYRWAWTGVRQPRVGHGHPLETDIDGEPALNEHALNGGPVRPNPLYRPAE